MWNLNKKPSKKTRKRKGYLGRGGLPAGQVRRMSMRKSVSALKTVGGCAAVVYTTENDTMFP